MPVVDVRFRLRGTEIPVDHGYQLFSAISRVVSQLHRDETVGVHPIAGEFSGDRLQRVNNRSLLIVRIDAARIAEVLPLAGKELRLGEHSLRVGVPYIAALKPTARLYSRLVTIKGFTEPEPFLDAARRQLEEMGVRGTPALVGQHDVAEVNRGKRSGTRSPYLRRTIRIRDKEIVGFAVRVEGLTAEESVLLQERGLGGRRRFGCGLFIPYRRSHV
jgi:CRISPR-associated protein Cas6